MLVPDTRAFDEGPFGQELIQIELGLKPWPEPDVKRQHFIPRFLLNRFARGNERLTQLDKQTGRPQGISVASAASRHRFYTFADEAGHRSSVVEDIFAMVESHAAPALKRLENDGEVTDIDRATIALFLAYLWARTPAARQVAERLAREASAGLMASRVADHKAFMELLRELARDDEELRKTPEEAEELRQRTLAMLADGSLRMTSADGGAPTAMLLDVAHEQALLLYAAMEWTLMRAGGGEFVTSDRGTASFDPTPQHPWSAHGLFSSPNTETYFPISTTCCLVVSPGEPIVRTNEIGLAQVTEANLRIYGWADRYIYGQDQEAVCAVRRAFKRSPQLAPAPRPQRLVTVIERDPEDDRLARAHLARGWQSYMIERGEDGRLRELDYMVLGEDGNAVEIALSSNELVRRRALKAAGHDPDSGVEIPGTVRTKAIHPGTIKPTLW